MRLAGALAIFYFFRDHILYFFKQSGQICVITESASRETRIMAAELEMRIFQAHDYVKAFLLEDLRPDGRVIGETRPVVVNSGSINSADGSAMVKLGNTIVVAGIKAEITKPKPEDQDRGVIIPNVQLPPLCSSRFKSGPPSEEAQSMSTYINNIISLPQVLDHTQLCIKPGQYCWLLHIDIICCNYDGNVSDASLIAVIAALQDLRLPLTEMNAETEELEISTQILEHIGLINTPVPLTFNLFDGKILLPDATDEEEKVSDGSISLVSLDGDTLCHLTKLGGTSINLQQLEMCVEKANERWREVSAIYNDQM